MNAQQIKQLAYQCGADICGIASLDRFDGAPANMDPRYIMPEAKSMIVMGFRVMRGSLRGIEEGTFFSNYAAMGYGGLTYLYIPMTVMNMCRTIEDLGYEAIPLGHQSDWRGIDNEGNRREHYSKPVEPGKPQPDIMLHLRICAYLAGLGEIGYSKMFLTPEFGPRLRIGVILTELELEPDPIYNGPKLCNKCKACVRECPGNAISGEKTVKVTLAGHEVEWGELDCDACDIAFRGGELCAEGERICNGDLTAAIRRMKTPPGQRQRQASRGVPPVVNPATGRNCSTWVEIAEVYRIPVSTIYRRRARGRSLSEVLTVGRVKNNIMDHVKRDKK